MDIFKLQNKYIKENLLGSAWSNLKFLRNNLLKVFLFWFVYTSFTASGKTVKLIDVVRMKIISLMFDKSFLLFFNINNTPMW